MTEYREWLQSELTALRQVDCNSADEIDEKMQPANEALYARARADRIADEVVTKVNPSEYVGPAVDEFPGQVPDNKYVDVIEKRAEFIARRRFSLTHYSGKVPSSLLDQTRGQALRELFEEGQAKLERTTHRARLVRRRAGLIDMELTEEMNALLREILDAS